MLHAVIDWEPHKSLEIYLNAVRYPFLLQRYLLLEYVPQETIFVADGGQDYRTECAKSGEPLLESMRIPGEPYPEALELPLVHMLQGNPYGRSAYEVRLAPCEHAP
jgi:amidase